MKKIVKQIIQFPVRVLLGKGIVDKYAPFLIPLFQKAYAVLQGDRIREVTLAYNLTLKVFAKDVGISLPLLLKGKYEPLSTKRFLGVISPGNTVIDIGANVGYYTVLAAYAVKNNGAVIAFEPDAENCRLLDANVKYNNFSNVLVRPYAVSDSNGKKLFDSHTASKGESALAVKNSSSTRTIQSVTLDSEVKRLKLQKVTVIKMDIEGAEILALQGAKETIRKNPVTLFIEYNPSRIEYYGYKPHAQLNLIENLGLEIKEIIDESCSKVLPYSEKNLAYVLSHTTFCNLVCIKSSQRRPSNTR